MRVLTVVGARPQFVKAALLSNEFSLRGIEERLVHSGQHYDFGMSQSFFDQLALRKPHYFLEVGSGSHAFQTGEIMKRLEPHIESWSPDWTLVFGDTNTTLAGALTASKLRCPVAHVEAGLRSFNRDMPEEINRIVADHVSDLLFAPTASAAEQLVREGLGARVEVVGDLMIDLLKRTVDGLAPNPSILQRLNVRSKDYALVTVHRAANTDNPDAFLEIVNALRALGMPVVFPIHPRTKPIAERCGVGDGDNIIVCGPLPYLDMVAMQLHARIILTDSGGLQKEAVQLGVPCVTLRNETEWKETLADGWNVLTGTDFDAIQRASKRLAPETKAKLPYGDGKSASRIVKALRRYANSKVAARGQRLVAEPTVNRL